MNILSKLILLTSLTVSTFCFAGGVEPPTRTGDIPVLTMRQVKDILGEPGFHIYDVNTTELWEEGSLPGAVFFNVKNWSELLPKDKEDILIFYCSNKLCLSSEDAAHAVRELGYKNVFLMPDGIYGWRIANLPIDRHPKSKDNN